MADGLTIEDPDIEVTLDDDGNGTVVVTMENDTNEALTPQVLDAADVASYVAVQGAPKTCAIAVEGKEIGPGTTETVSISFAGCKASEGEATEGTTPVILVADIEHEVEFGSATTIDGAAILVPLLIGLVAFGIVSAYGWDRMMWNRVKKREEPRTNRVLVDPPAVFSVKDGWLTNLTALSAGAVAFAASTDLADVLLAKSEQVEIALVGFIVIALLGLSPIVLSMLTTLKDPNATEDSKDPKKSKNPRKRSSAAPAEVKYRTEVPVLAYVLACSITAGSAVAQLSGLGWAAQDAKFSGFVAGVCLAACVVLGLIAVLYAVRFIEKTLALSVEPSKVAPSTEPEQFTMSNAPSMPRSLVL